MQATIHPERRAERRFALFLPASLRTGAASTRVHLRNLSRSGALAEAPRPPAAGSRVTLSRAGLLLDADVMWSQGLRFGLRFATPIEAPDLLAELSRGR